MLTILFIIAKKVQIIQMASTNKWINKMWYIYAMEYYSSIKRNKVDDTT